MMFAKLMVTGGNRKQETSVEIPLQRHCYCSDVVEIRHAHQATEVFTSDNEADSTDFLAHVVSIEIIVFSNLTSSFKFPPSFLSPPLFLALFGCSEKIVLFTMRGI